MMLFIYYQKIVITLWNMLLNKFCNKQWYVLNAQIVQIIVKQKKVIQLPK